MIDMIQAGAKGQVRWVNSLLGTSLEYAEMKNQHILRFFKFSGIIMALLPSMLHH